MHALKDTYLFLVDLVPIDALSQQVECLLATRHCAWCWKWGRLSASMAQVLHRWYHNHVNIKLQL